MPDGAHGYPPAHAQGGLDVDMYVPTNYQDLMISCLQLPHRWHVAGVTIRQSCSRSFGRQFAQKLKTYFCSQHRLQTDCDQVPGGEFSW
eukprot:2245215-Prymnesium_polylepis.1